LSFVNHEAILQAKRMDLLTYLQNYEPNELVHVSGDSVHIMIAQMVVRLTFEPLVEPIFFCEDSYGYRPNKSALDAAVGVCIPNLSTSTINMAPKKYYNRYMLQKTA